MASYRKLPSGLWQATVRKPNGKRVTETDKLKSVVRDWATELEARYKRGDRRDPHAGRITLGAWHQRVTSARRLEGSTTKKIASIWRTHCEEEWAEWPMNSVARLEAQAWVNELGMRRRARHKGKQVRDEDTNVPAISAATIHEAVFVMTSLYKYALAEDPPLVASNPFASLDLPKIEPIPVRFYEHAEAELLYTATEQMFGPHWRALIELGMHIGLRPGEIYGLHTDRVDWARGLISVTRVVTRAGIREYAKSRKSHRTVPGPPGTLALIGKQLGGRRNWAGECRCPKVLPDGSTKPGRGPCPGLVFSAPAGGPVDDGNFRDRIWYPAVEAARTCGRPAPTRAAAGVRHEPGRCTEAVCDSAEHMIRRYPPQIMRHTAASWLVQDAVPLYDVQGLLGHESFTTTQRYAHLAPGALDKVTQSWARRAQLS